VEAFSLAFESTGTYSPVNPRLKGSMHSIKSTTFLFLRDTVISIGQKPKSITKLAEEVGLWPSEVLPYGHTKAKVDIKVLDRLSEKRLGKYVFVTGYRLVPEIQGRRRFSAAQVN
jgi:Formate--tetrahydrofolate ligase